MKTNNVLNSTGLLNRGIEKTDYIFTYENGLDVVLFAITPTLSDASRYYSSLSFDDISPFGWSFCDIHCYRRVNENVVRKYF